MLLLGEIQFLSKGFLFLAMSRSSRVRFYVFVAGKFHTVDFPHFCFQVIIVLLILVLFVLFLIAVISLSLFFWCNLRDLLLMYRRYLQCWRVLFLLFFLSYIVSLYHLCDVSPIKSSLVFLFSGSFVDALPSSSLRIVPSILQEGQPRCLDEISAI